MKLIRPFSINNSKQAGIDTLVTGAGFVGAHQIVSKIIKQDTLIVNAGVLVFGAALKTMADNKNLQSAGIGIALFGFIKAVNNLASDTVKVTDEKAVHGVLPETVRSVLKSTFPTLGNADEYVAGTEFKLDEPVEVRSIATNGFGNPLYMNGAEEEPVNGAAPQMLMAS